MSDSGFAAPRYRVPQRIQTVAPVNLEGVIGDQRVYTVSEPAIEIREVWLQAMAVGPTQAQITAATAVRAVITVDIIRANLDAHNFFKSTVTPLAVATRAEVVTFNYPADLIVYDLARKSASVTFGKNLERPDYPKAYAGDQVIIKLKTLGSGLGDQTAFLGLTYWETALSFKDDEETDSAVVKQN